MNLHCKNLRERGATAAFLLGITFMGFAANLEQNLSGGIAGLKHRWRFDGNFLDEVAGRTASVVLWNSGSPTPWSFQGNCLDLNNGWNEKWSSSATFIRLPQGIISDIANEGATDFTLEMWVETDDSKWNSGYFAFAPENRPGDGTPRLAWTSYENDYFKVSWRQSAGGYWHQMGGPENLKPPMSGLQHLVLIVQDASDTLKVYVDNVLKGTWTGPAWEGPGLNAAAWWNGVGGYLGIAPDNEAALDGKIYDFRIWARALSPTDILQSFGMGPEAATYARPPLSIKKLEDGQIELRWAGTLLESSSPTGPDWTPVPATSPWTNSPTGSKYYRARF